MSQSNQYMGIYAAEVVSVDDPEKRCRIKVNVYDLCDGVPTDSLPWANFNLPLGSRPGEGAINPVQVGDKVWVQFVNGDSRRPIVSGSSQAAPESKVNLAPEVCQGDGQFEHKRTEDQPPVDSPPYYRDVVYCQNRALIQLCRAGNIRVTQMDSGSAIEILPNGNMVVHCEGDIFVSATGNMLETIDGDYTQKIKGNYTQEIQGSMSMTSKGPASYGSSESSLNLAAATQGSMSGPGGLNFKGPTTMQDSLTVQSNITASGTIMDSAGNSNHHSH